MVEVTLTLSDRLDKNLGVVNTHRRVSADFFQPFCGKILGKFLGMNMSWRASLDSFNHLSEVDEVVLIVDTAYCCHEETIT